MKYFKVAIVSLFFFSTLLTRTAFIQAADQQPQEVQANIIEIILNELFGGSNGTDTPPPSSGSTLLTPDPNSPFQPISPTPGLLPPKPSTSFTQKIDQIVSAIQACGGQIMTGSFGCLNNLTSVLPKSAIDIMKASTTKFKYLQCVGFAQAMAEANGKPFKSSGHAKNIIGQSVPGYRYYSKNNTQGRMIQPGDLPLWDSGTYGHIAYVKSVDGIFREPDGSCGYTFIIAEANFQVNGSVRNGRPVTCSTPDFRGWQSPL